MGRPRKDPSELSEAYRKRIERGEAQGKTRSEAGGHAKKAPKEKVVKEPKQKEPKQQKPKQTKTKTKKEKVAKTPKPSGGGRKKKEFHELSPSYQKRILKYLESHPDASLSEARGHAPRKEKEDEKTEDLEWVIWSQKRKLGNLTVKQRFEGLPKETADEARKILNKMIKLTTEMYEKYPFGTTGYYDCQDKLKPLYKKLRALGVLANKGDIEHGDVGYH
jgi:hypothetical protein